MATQRDLAQHLGLSQSAISRALRGDASIPLETQARVREAARAIGYFPHPHLVTLMEKVRAGEPIRDLGCLAIVVDAADEAAWLTHPAYAQQYEAMVQRAHKRGFRPECFFLRAPGMSPKRLDRVLDSRGITALILATPCRERPLPLPIRWERYACVASGYTWREPAVDRIVPHHRHHVEMAFRKLGERGYRRIGFCLPTSAQERVDQNWLGGWLLCQHRLPRERRIPLFAGSPWDSTQKEFMQWIDRWRPDAIVTLRANELPWLQAAGVEPGRDLGVVTLYPVERNGLTWIDENNEIIGEMLCDLVLAHLVHGERGIPPHSRQIAVEGSWVEGQSTPVRKP